MAGVYRAGRGAELWIDGELVDEAPSRGIPVEGSAGLTVGHLPGGTARLAGDLMDIRVRGGVRARGLGAHLLGEPPRPRPLSIGLEA